VKPHTEAGDSYLGSLNIEQIKEFMIAGDKSIMPAPDSKMWLHGILVDLFPVGYLDAYPNVAIAQVKIVPEDVDDVAESLFTKNLCMLVAPEDQRRSACVTFAYIIPGYDKNDNMLQLALINPG
jgi:hypothetical protein